MMMAAYTAKNDIAKAGCPAFAMKVVATLMAIRIAFSTKNRFMTPPQEITLK